MGAILVFLTSNMKKFIQINDESKNITNCVKPSQILQSIMRYILERQTIFK